MNLLDNLPTTLKEESTTTLLDTSTVRIERIVSQGHASPEGFWYDQDQHEWVMFVKGAARLRFQDDEQPVEMKQGASINIYNTIGTNHPGRKEHSRWPP